MRGVEVDREAVRDMKDNIIRFHEFYSPSTPGGYIRCRDFECQYDYKTDNICTCKPKRRETGYFNTSRQVYRSQRYTLRDFRDIGIGSVKTVHKRRLRRVYLPATEERGTGSTDISPFIRRRKRHRGEGYYELKETSSKCIGGVIENINIPVLDKKVSPIIQYKSRSTSPKLSITANNETLDNDLATNIPIKNNSVKPWQASTSQKDFMPTYSKNKTTGLNNTDDGQNFSSDSLVQHVHNLENPSDDKIRTSTDFIENKLEKEYRKLFTAKQDNNDITKEKTIPDIKSTSLLRRRFEALRRGLCKKECLIKESVNFEASNKISVPSHRDVSIASDPPSLEARSISNTKIYSPVTSFTNPYDKTIDKAYDKICVDEEMPLNALTDAVSNEYQDVKGMFKLWGEKFNLEENYKETSPNASKDKNQKKKVKLDMPIEEPVTKKKKEGKRFLFFGRKNKNKIKQPFKSKQGITAGRCELRDGFMIKIGNPSAYAPEVRSRINRDYEDYNISNKDWFKRFVTNRIDSRNSVRIRWNNNMYTTSSSTVFELMDCMYRNTGIILSSRSEISTENSSYYHTFAQPQVNFMQQSIQAWMIPNTTTDIENIILEAPTKIFPEKKGNKIEVTFPNKKWFIDKSKAFAQKIEFVLHSKNLVGSDKSESSEYIVIDIPQGYFSDTSNDDKGTDLTSDEQVYNVIEYETLKSTSFLKKKKIEPIFDTGYEVLQDRLPLRSHEDDNFKFLGKNKDEPLINKNIENGCDYISVGIITQTDIRDMNKSILKINNEIDDESRHALPPKTCEFAESFLQDYYRNWTSLGTDLLSWCLSDNKLQRHEINSVTSFNNQGDGSKSCSNIYDQASTIVSSCETSSCSHCIAFEEGKKTDDSKANKFFGKFKKKNNEQFRQTSNEKRVWPKDSIEVFKRRKIYAASNKSKWGVNNDQCDSFLVSKKSNERNILQHPRVRNTCSDIDDGIKKNCKKRVMLQDCDVMNDILKEQLSDKVVEGILSFKGAKSCDDCKNKPSQPIKQAQVIPHPTTEIPQPPCKESCIKESKPPCSKKNSPTCNVPTPPPCPEGPPSPCKKPCPPSPPPCRMIPPCLLSPPRSASPKSRSNSTQHDYRKPIPPRIHSPNLSSPKSSRPCICPKRRSLCNIPKCPVVEKFSSRSTSPQLPKLSSRQTLLQSRSKSSCKCCKSVSSEKVKKTSSHKFPWPLKNQQSNAPSKESGLNLKKSASPTEKFSNKCVSALKRLIEKISSSSIKQQDCKRDVIPTPTNASKSRPKMQGLHLKKLPMPKNLSKDSLSRFDQGEGVIRLNSREKLTIKLKQSTPSTEEIREGCNIKVQDEDGQTLYERRDYRKIDRNRMQFVKDLYRDSHVQVQRLSTSNIDKVLDEKPFELNECKSDTSLSNIIEINLNLKIKQQEKTTELTIKKEGDSLKNEPDSCEVTDEHQIDNQVYMVQDKQKSVNDDTEKRDVDIKIMIKNYKAPVKLLPTNKHSVSLSADDFSKKISEKFQSVSTGYSDIIERQTYSIHRATIDLTNSSENNKSLSKLSAEILSKVLTESIPTDRCGCISDHRINSNTVSDKDEQSTTKSNTKIDTSIEKTFYDKSGTSLTLTNDEYMHSDDTNFEEKSFTEIRKSNRDDKKQILKQILKEASNINKCNDKSKVEEIKHLLRAVLTSDSSHEVLEGNNELAKEFTFNLDPEKFDRVNSYDNTSNSTKLTSNEESEVYPTKEITSVSDSSFQENAGCLCSHFGAKLNITKNPCCCRKYKIDEEVICDLNRHSFAEVETQYSDCLKNNNVSLNLIRKHSTKYSNNTSFIKCSNNNFNKNPKSEEINSTEHTLQLNETKKAVLEIYAEKFGQRQIARLPKFISGTEEQIYKYEASKKSIVLSIHQ